MHKIDQHEGYVLNTEQELVYNFFTKVYSTHTISGATTAITEIIATTAITEPPAFHPLLVAEIAATTGRASSFNPKRKKTTSLDWQDFVLSIKTLPDESQER